MNFTAWTGPGAATRTLLCLVMTVTALAIATADRPMTACEVDALAGGGTLVDALYGGEGPVGDRLHAGFLVDEAHPRAADFARRRTWRRHLADPPLPRWVAGAAILIAPEPVSDRQATHWMACLLMALAALGAGIVVGAALFPPSGREVGLVGKGKRAASGIVGAAATLGTAGALDAAGGSGAAAVAAFSMAALLVACQRLVDGRGGALPIGVAWGALLACHPAGLFLVVPIFAAVAIAWPATPSAGGAENPTAMALPGIPPLLLATPVVAVGLLVALWPALWLETSRGLAIWLTDTWWAVAPNQTVAGEAYHQPGGRAPAAFTATLQWLVWTPWPLLLAWVAGVVVAVRQGRAGLWLPILIVAMVLLVGGADGGLFGARRSLLAWLWVPTAATAAVGLSRLGRRPAIAVAAACMVWSLAFDPWGAAAVGAEARGAAPVSELKAIAADEPGALVHVASAVPGQRQAVETLRWRDGLDLRWSGPDKARWAVVLGDRAGWWSTEEAVGSGLVGGVPARTFRRP